MRASAVAAAACAMALSAAASALGQQPAASPPVAPPLAGQPLTSHDLEAVKVPYLQTVRLQVPGVYRVLSVNPDMIEARIIPTEIVELRALNFGQTFVHFWTPEGRQTRAIEVIQPIFEVPPGLIQPKNAQELARHLVFEYQNSFRSTQRGPSLDELDRTTTTRFYHNLSSRMGTPFGRASGSVTFERFNSVSEFTTWNVALTDGDIGPLERFSVAAGDISVGFSDLSLPEGNIHGVWGSYYDIEPYNLEAFYGRRQLGFTSGLSAGLESRDDFFLTGTRLQDTSKPLTWSIAQAVASGDDRIEVQTGQATEVNTWYWWNEGNRAGIEAGLTQDDAFGYRLRWQTSQPTLTTNTTYRNISQRYDNLLGRMTDQGERGVLMNASWTPTSHLRVRQFLDLYEDTLFRNPAEPDVLNLDADWSADIDLTDSTLLTGGYSRQRLLGQLFPSDSYSVSTGLRQRLAGLPLLDGGYAFGDYRFRDTRNVNSPDADFSSHGVTIGLGAPLWRYLSWRVSQEWTLLEETLSGLESQPRQTSAGLSYSQQFRRVPLTLHGGVDFSTAAGSGSANSFILQEDRWSFNGGARYDFSPEAHAFLDSRLIRAERATETDYEFEFETGVRYLFDTGITWEPSATLSGIVFTDTDGNGTQEPGETGLSRVTVRAGDVKEAVTDPGGRFYLGRVRGRQVEVAVDLKTVPAGYVPTTPAAMTVDLKHPPQPPMRFGFVPQTELRVRVFLDAQGDGRYDATDVPLEKVRVALQDGQALRTDRSGWAFFRSLRPGRYTVTISVNDLPIGAVPMVPVSQEQQLSEGKATSLDVPAKAQRSIGGRVYVDRNRNARFDEEPGLAGVTVCLNRSRRVATQEDGRYLFKDVPAGVHRVEINCGAPLAGYLPLNAAAQTAELPVHPTVLDRVDFRLGQQDAMMQDVVADVLRARKEREQLIKEMIDLKQPPGEPSDD